MKSTINWNPTWVYTVHCTFLKKGLNIVVLFDASCLSHFCVVTLET